MLTPAEEAGRLTADLQTLSQRLAASEEGAALFTREDLDRLIERRLTRERKKRRAVEAERDELEAELEALRETGSGTPAT